MSKQVRSDGRRQAALLQAFRSAAPPAKLAEYVRRRNLMCCDLTALQILKNAWIDKGSPSLMCGDGDCTVLHLILKFIEVRQKQSPLWRKEQEKAISQPTQLDQLLLDSKIPESTSTTRRPGMATPADELQNWPDDKLISEVRKQIRRDFGGKSEAWVLAWIITELQGKTPKEQAVWVHELLGKQTDGSRDRVESKLVEIGRRLRELRREIERRLQELRRRNQGA